MKEELIQLSQKLPLKGNRVAVVFEGRDTAGKTSTIRELTKYLNPEWYRVCESHKPSEWAMDNWLEYWESLLPKEGEIVFYDRSWYSRALVQVINGWCTEGQYLEFMSALAKWEDTQDVQFIKLWLSITEEEQISRMAARKVCPLRSWRYSPNDDLALESFHCYTAFKKKMFNQTKGWCSLDYSNKSKGRKDACRIISGQI